MFKEWIDTRDITKAIDAHLGVLIEMESEREALDQLINDQ
jgi:hypothetical protein